MVQPEYDEILNQYQYREGYSTFEKYRSWFKENIETGKIRPLLKNTLLEVKKTKSLRKYDFVLLVIQAMRIDFIEEDNHFELLFEIADLITKEFKESQNGDKESWLLHQLTDICIHNDDQVELTAKRNSNLIPRVIEKIGKVKYEPKAYGPQMYFAAYKAVGLFWYIPQEISKEIIQEVYLKHFDKRVVEETEELIEHLKEEGQYD